MLVRRAFTSPNVMRIRPGNGRTRVITSCDVSRDRDIMETTGSIWGSGKRAA